MFTVFISHHHISINNHAALIIIIINNSLPETVSVFGARLSVLSISLQLLVNEDPWSLSLHVFQVAIWI